jgi:hypothetical protein
MKNRKIMKEYLQKFNFIMVMVLIFQCPLFAQIKEIKNVPSPEVANLSTFGNIPIGHYTGTPEVSVPIYEISVDNLKIPITAVYHIANVKPHTPPSTLGIGWSLSAGGYIARTVRTVQDEKETYTTKAGYYFNYNKINNIDNSSSPEQGLKDNIRMERNDWYELSADEFTFNFLGYSGSFYLGNDGQWKVCSDQNIKVEFDEGTGFTMINDLRKRFSLSYYGNINFNMRLFKKFTLITPDGIRCEFGGEKATEYSVPYYFQVDRDIIATCWRLSKITTLHGREIIFNYSNDSYMCDIHYAPQLLYPYLDNRGQGMIVNRGRSGYSGFLLMPVRLNKISTDSEIIDLEYDRGYMYGNLFKKNTGCLYWEDNLNKGYDYNFRYGYNNIENEINQHRFMLFMNVSPQQSEYATRNSIAEKLTYYYLKKIYIQKAGHSVMNVVFDWEYIKSRYLLSGINFRVFHPFEGDFDNLDFIEKTALPSSNLNNSLTNMPPRKGRKQFNNPGFELFKSDTIYTYRFSYYNTENLDILWPDRSPLAYTDSWGYYSRYSSNPYEQGEWSLSAGYTSSDFKTRFPSLEATKSFALKEIVYPTGGKSTFEYELNDYSKQFNLFKQQVSITGMGVAGGLRISKIYNYDLDDKIICTKNYYYKESINSPNSSGISKGEPIYYERLYFNSDKSDFIDFYSFDPLTPYPLNFNTPDVGYSSVIEDIRDRNGKLMTRTRYRYTNYDTDINQLSHMDVPAYGSYNVFANLKTASFTSMAFERGKLISEEILDENSSVLSKTTYSYIRTSGEPFTTVEQSFYLTPNLTEFCYAFLYKTYINQYLIKTKKTEQMLKNGLLATTTSYNYDRRGLLQEKRISSNLGKSEIHSYLYTYNNASYRWMTDKNIIWPISHNVRWGQAYSGEVIDYAASSTGIPYISKKSVWMSDNPNEKWTANILFEITKTDMYGNPIEILEKGIKTIMIWSFHGKRPIAMVTNATYEDVQTILEQAPETFSQLNPSHTTYLQINNLRKKLLHSLVTTYEYDSKLNLIAQTEANGVVYEYSYDSLGRLVTKSRKIENKSQRLNQYQYVYKTKGNK